jgi:hypothetical protein
MLRLIKRLAAASIWAPGAIPASEAKYAVPLKRYVIPAVDLIFVGGGVFAITNGIPSFEQLVPVAAYAFSLVFIAVALICLIGISFPALWALEVFGKCGLIMFCGTYAVALFIRGVPFTATFFIALAVFLAYRLWILGDEEGERRDRGADR